MLLMFLPSSLVTIYKLSLVKKTICFISSKQKMFAYCIFLILLTALANGRRVVYDWTISEINTKMDGIHDRMAVAVNGQVPMPLATAQLGDTLVLTVRNGLSKEATGLHSHGLFNNGTNYYDGAGMVTECGIAPGSAMSYEIPLKQTGTYWLHGHHNSQYINGLRGPLIITDPRGEPYQYDEDLVMTFEDWFPHASTMTMGSMNDNNSTHRDHDRDSPFRENSAKQSESHKYPLGVINGAHGKYAPRLAFEPGKTYRLRLLNIGSTMMFRFAIEGHDMWVIEADGVLTERKRVNSVTLGVAQRMSVLVRAKPRVTNNYKYRVDIFTDVFPKLAGHNPRNYWGDVQYHPLAPYDPEANVVWDAFTEDLNLVPLEKQPLLQRDVTHDIVLRADRTPTDLLAAYINGISFKLPKTPSLFTALMYHSSNPMNGTAFGHECNAKVIRHMDVAELRIMNQDVVTHPMHLHGQFFQIVERGWLDNPTQFTKSSGWPMRRDTVLVRPHEYVVLRFRADNPGVWLMHCHIERHMELGLSMMFVAAPDRMIENLEIPEIMKQQCRLLDVPI